MRNRVRSGNHLAGSEVIVLGHPVWYFVRISSEWHDSGHEVRISTIMDFSSSPLHADELVVDVIESEIYASYCPVAMLDALLLVDVDVN